ncbi:MAG: hypothetical protein S0880_26640 [Actinomycetota bacterium]|nr:hypothetical protein [Actinomycetota bacterium]
MTDASMTGERATASADISVHHSRAELGTPTRSGFAVAWGRWYEWVDAHPIGAIALVGFIATQMGTYFGYVFPAVGLPVLPWPLYNGVLASPAEPFGSAASFFTGQSLHFLNGIVFAILYAAFVRPSLPLPDTHSGNIAKGLVYGVAMTIISIGVLVPYAYVPDQGYGFFSFSGPDGWKLPAGVLVWHLIYGFMLGTLYQPSDRSPR